MHRQLTATGQREILARRLGGPSGALRRRLPALQHQSRPHGASGRVLSHPGGKGPPCNRRAPDRRRDLYQGLPAYMAGGAELPPVRRKSCRGPRPLADCHGGARGDMFAWLRREAGPRAAWIGAVLFGISPFAVDMAQFCRFYALQSLAMFVTAMRRLRGGQVPAPIPRCAAAGPARCSPSGRCCWPSICSRPACSAPRGSAYGRSPRSGCPGWPTLACPGRKLAGCWSAPCWPLSRPPPLRSLPASRPISGASTTGRRCSISGAAISSGSIMAGTACSIRPCGR